MFDKYNTIVNAIIAGGVTCRKHSTVFTDGGDALSIPGDTAELCVVNPLDSVHDVQWAKDRPAFDRYQLLFLAKGDDEARALADTVINDENAATAPILELPHYRIQTSRKVPTKVRDFFVYERIIEVSPNAS